MSQQQPDPARPRPRRATTRSKTPPSNRSQPLEKAPARPAHNDREGWRTYWKECQQPWRWEPEIDARQQEELAIRRAIVPDVEQGIYPFSGMKLTRADIEWLLATHENGRGPVDWNDESQRWRTGLDLRGAYLGGSENEHIDLMSLPLTQLNSDFDSEILLSIEQMKLAKVTLIRAYLDGAHLENANFSEAYLKTVDFDRAHLERANFGRAYLEVVDFGEAYLEGANFDRAHLKDVHFDKAHLERAKLSQAQLEGADLSEAHLEGADLSQAQLEGADFHETHLENANLFRAQLRGADLSRAYLEGANLREVFLADSQGVGPHLADVQWSGVNLAVVDWSQVKILGNEYKAQRKKSEYGEVKDKKQYLDEYREAVRANRQLAVALQAQGLNEEAARFAYRANVLQRKVLWFQMIQPNVSFRQRVRKFGAWVFSHLLNLVAGYGYKPERSFLAYLLVIFGFMGLYLITSHFTTPHLSWDEALVLSLSSFHGRGFFPQTITLGDAYARLAVTEAVLGLFIEISFIATFTQRFFGK